MKKQDGQGRMWMVRSAAFAAASILFLSGCTDVSKWGLTSSQVVAASSDVVKVESTAGVITFGDQEVSQAEVDYSNWTFDSQDLYTDPTYKKEQFSAFPTAQMGEVIQVEGRGLSVTIDHAEVFEDAMGSGRHGIAIIYTITNHSGNPVFFNGINENVMTFSMFSPDDVSLKTHYNLLTAEPTSDQDYPKRIKFPKDIYTPSMISRELASGDSVQMYRTYDFAGKGEYMLYVCTDKFGRLDNQAVGVPIVL